MKIKFRTGYKMVLLRNLFDKPILFVALHKNKHQLRVNSAMMDISSKNDNIIHSSGGTNGTLRD